MTAASSKVLQASVVVPSYKGQGKLPTLLHALEQQDASRETWEAIIVIDGVFDDSPTLVQEAAERGVPVRTIVLEENQGRVGALNAGFAAAQGHVLIRCDDDLEPGPSYVSDHIARHATATEPIGVVGIYQDVLTENRYSDIYGMPREGRFRAQAYDGALPAWRYWAGNCSVTRETYDSIGGYSEAYTHYGWEDVDFGYRLAHSGVEVILAPELETIHHGAAISTFSRTLRAYHSGAARRTFETRHPGVMPSPPAPGSWWQRLVSHAADGANARTVETRASLVDAALPYLPRRVAEKFIALSVESASLAGYDSADESLVSDF